MTGPSIWMQPFRTLILHPPNLHTRGQAQEVNWLLSVCTVIPQDTRLLMMEVTLPHFMTDLFTGVHPDLILQAGMKVEALSHHSMKDLILMVLAGWMVVDLFRGLKDTDQ